jgi:quinol monooxygenase YgiN
VISVIAKFTIKSGRLNEATDLFKEYVKQVATEEGIVAFSLNVAKSEPNALVVLERFKDQQCLNMHANSTHFKEHSAKIEAMLSGPAKITLMEEIASI